MTQNSLGKVNNLRYRGPPTAWRMDDVELTLWFVFEDSFFWKWMFFASLFPLTVDIFTSANRVVEMGMDSGFSLVLTTTFVPALVCCLEVYKKYR